MMTRLTCTLLFLLAGTEAMAEPQSCATLIEDNQAQLQKLKRYVSDISAHTKRLSGALEQAEARGQQQVGLILQLEEKLNQYQSADLSFQSTLKQHFFTELARYLKASPIYRIHKQRVIIPTDAVYIFGKGQMGEEGERRLKPLVDAISKATKILPAGIAWSLGMQGHTDARPIKSSSRFASNWELSAARAVTMARYFVKQGVEQQRLQATGLAATRLLAEGTGKANHRRNRRIEIHLQFE